MVLLVSMASILINPFPAYANNTARPFARHTRITNEDYRRPLLNIESIVEARGWYWAVIIYCARSRNLINHIVLDVAAWGIAHPDITLTPSAQRRVVKEIQKLYSIFETWFIFKLRSLILMNAQLSEYSRSNKINYCRGICGLRIISIILQMVTNASPSRAWSIRYWVALEYDNP